MKASVSRRLTPTSATGNVVHDIVQNHERQMFKAD
jgi:hypothetical protein